MEPVRDADEMSTVTDSTFLVSEPQSHNSWSTIGSALLQPGAPRLRVYVVLSTGQRLLVPVPSTATIQDLQFQALRRAARLGVQVGLGDTVVRTTGAEAALVDGQDMVSDFIDLTADHTFALDILNTTVSCWFKSLLRPVLSCTNYPRIPHRLFQEPLYIPPSPFEHFTALSLMLRKRTVRFISDGLRPKMPSIQPSSSAYPSIIRHGILNPR